MEGFEPEFNTSRDGDSTAASNGGPTQATELLAEPLQKSEWCGAETYSPPSDGEVCYQNVSANETFDERYEKKAIQKLKVYISFTFLYSFSYLDLLLPSIHQG